MREPSVTTITWTSSCGQLYIIEPKWPRSSREKYLSTLRLRIARPNCAAPNCAELRGAHAARADVLRAKLLADVADGRRVDQRRELLDVVDEEAVVQRLVAVVEVLQHQVLLHVRHRRVAHLQQEAPRLVVDVLDHRRDQTAHVEAVALGVVERHALVPQRVVQDVDAGLLGLQGLREATLLGGGGGGGEWPQTGRAEWPQTGCAEWPERPQSGRAEHVRRAAPTHLPAKMTISV